MGSVGATPFYQGFYVLPELHARSGNRYPKALGRKSSHRAAALPGVTSLRSA